MPPELDEAIRVALERDPAQRYASALDMAAAMDAGARGEHTAATQAFSIGSTQLLGDDPGTDATQALPATRLPTRSTRRAEPAAVLPPERPERRPRERKKSSGGRARLIALLLVLVLAGAAVAILVSGTSGSGYTNINAGSPRDQAQELINYIRQHRR